MFGVGCFCQTQPDPEDSALVPVLSEDWFVSLPLHLGKLGAGCI